MKKIMVTGASGFVGEYLVEELVRTGYTVCAVERNVMKAEKDNFKFIKCKLKEISQLDMLIEDRDIDTCIHLAWCGSTGGCRTDADIQLKNIEYSLDLVKSLAKIKIKKFIGIESLAEKDTMKY